MGDSSGHLDDHLDRDAPDLVVVVVEQDVVHALLLLLIFSPGQPLFLHSKEGTGERTLPFSAWTISGPETMTAR